MRNYHHKSQCRGCLGVGEVRTVVQKGQGDSLGASCVLFRALGIHTRASFMIIY